MSDEFKKALNIKEREDENPQMDKILDEDKKIICVEIEGEGFINAVKIIAYIDLVCSVIAFFIFIVKSVEVSRYSENMKIQMITLAFVYLIGGIIMFVLLMAVHYIGKNVINQSRQMNR